MFVKVSLRDKLICFADFVGMTLLACRTPMAPFLFLLPLPNYFLKVCLPTLFAAVLKFILPLTTSATSGTATSNKSAPPRAFYTTCSLEEICYSISSETIDTVIRS